MSLTVIKVSARRFVIGATVVDLGGGVNLSIYSQQRLGGGNELIPVSSTKVLTHKLDHEHAMLMFCLLSKKAELTERQWGYVLQERQDEVQMYHQLDDYGAHPHLAIPESEGREKE
jgi:hypothetical protein